MRIRLAMVLVALVQRQSDLCDTAGLGECHRLVSWTRTARLSTLWLGGSRPRLALEDRSCQPEECSLR